MKKRLIVLKTEHQDKSFLSPVTFETGPEKDFDSLNTVSSFRLAKTLVSTDIKENHIYQLVCTQGVLILLLPCSPNRNVTYFPLY